MNKKRVLIILAVFLLLISTTATAKRELTGDNLELQQREDGQVVFAEGNVELIYDQLRITAEDEGIYYRYNGDIEFRKNVKFFYQQYEGESLELTGNIEEEIFHLIDQVKIKGPESYLEADRVDVYQAENRMEAHDNTYLEYNDFWAEADKIIYYLDREFIHLEGNVRGERDGQKFSSNAADINQKTEEVNLSGQAKLVLPEEESSANGEESAGAEENDN